MRCQVGSMLFASSLLVSCIPKETAAVPTCPEVAVVDPTPVMDVEPPAPAVTEEPEEEDDDDEPDGSVVTRELNNVTVTVRADENESDEALDGHLRLEVTHDGVETVDVIERDVDMSGCLAAHLELDVDFIFSDGETLVFEATSRCIVGETVTRITIEHLVLATHEHGPGLSVLYEGTSQYINNRDLEVALDKREFYIEMGKLAVYKHTVQWCDEKTMKVALGDDHDCSPPSPRKLKLLERIPIFVPFNEE